ncbi:MAG TPA: hypothetical protein VGF75_02840, partial [Candidatus Saccharimonadales bacterium]
MKKSSIWLLAPLLLVLLVCPQKTLAQTVNTPNVGLEIPAGGSQNWNLPLNYNFNLIDQLLGGTLQTPGLGLQLKSLFGTGAPTVSCSVNNDSQQYFDVTNVPFFGYVCHNLSWSSFGGSGSGGGSFPGGFVFGLTSTTARTGTPSDFATLLSTLTGCTTANYVYSPANGACVAPAGFSGLGTGFIVTAQSPTGIQTSPNLDDGQTQAGYFTINENATVTGLLYSGGYHFNGGTTSINISGTTGLQFNSTSTLNTGQFSTLGNVTIGDGSNNSVLNLQNIKISNLCTVTPCESTQANTFNLVQIDTSNTFATITPTYLQFDALMTAGCLQSNSSGQVSSTGSACGSGGGGGGAFSAISTGINTSATMTVGTGASLLTSGSGIIAATSVPWSGITGTTPTWNQNTTGNAQTANTFATTPSVCGGGQVPVGILSNGNATGCFSPSGSLSGTTGKYGVFTGSSTMGSGTIDYGITTAGTNTSSVPFQINDGSGNGGTFTSYAGTTPSGASGLSKLFMSSSTNQFMVNQNGFGVAYLQSIVTPATPGNCAMFDSDGIRTTDAGAPCGTGGGGSFTPTFTIDTGAGTGGSLSVAFVSGANDNRGWIDVTTGNSPAASSGIITIKYGGTYSATRKCGVSGANLAAAALNGAASTWVPSTTATNALFVVQVGTTALAA